MNLQTPNFPSRFDCSLDVNEQSYNCSELRKALEVSHLDDIPIFWDGCFIHAVYHLFKDIRMNGKSFWDTSVLYCGLASQSNQIEWLVFSLMCGQYNLVNRELRNMLESSFFFCRADFEESHKHRSLVEKAQMLDTIDSKEKYGKKVFQLSGYPHWECVYNSLYRPLCAYTHTQYSLKEAEKLFEDYNDCSTPNFNKTEALQCLKNFQNVLTVECKLMDFILRNTYELTEGTDFSELFSGS